MLSRRSRLKKADFDVAYKEGKVLRHPLLICRCYWRPVAADDRPRAAFVAPRKLAKATGRNRWKRRLRHWFYEILQESAATAAADQLKWHRCDFIFILTAQGRDAPPREVFRAMRTLWRKAIHFPGHNGSARH